MTFPYIKQLKINDCFTYRDISIDTGVIEDSFKHIIITGKNGSGKTTILNRIAFLLNQIKRGNDPAMQINHLKSAIQSNPNDQSQEQWKKNLKEWSDVNLFFTTSDYNVLLKNKSDYILSFFKAHRKVNLTNVNTVTKETDFITKLSQNQNPENFANNFKQYLVNKKVYEAFDFMESKKDSINENKIFFDNLTETFREIFHDPKLELEFVRESFEFYLRLGDGRRNTFNELSEGFSAFLSILMDLLMRTDLTRKTKNDYSFNPSGFVIIDEPETHFHLAMQYEILPLITRLFPKLQLIVATHSPAIISSISNSIVYDLSSQQQVSDWLLGSSYSELMIKHFGLENEFSPTADKILLDVQESILSNDVKGLQKIILDNEKYLTPSLRLEIESQIIKLQSKNS
jgi:predicted ATP-binding protein involved in virulence